MKKIYSRPTTNTLANLQTVTMMAGSIKIDTGDGGGDPTPADPGYIGGGDARTEQSNIWDKQW